VTDTITYQLKAYVDNVKLSHHTRISKATKQVRRDIVDLFAHSDPPIPMARQAADITLDGLPLPVVIGNGHETP
jgi:hypothetical protein